MILLLPFQIAFLTLLFENEDSVLPLFHQQHLTVLNWIILPLQIYPIGGLEGVVIEC